MKKVLVWRFDELDGMPMQAVRLTLRTVNMRGFGEVQRLARLDGETKVYCAHEYTLSNAKFALHVDPDNRELIHRTANVEAMRARGEPTVPTTIALERATNPFMRAKDVDDLARLRTAKDNF